MKKKDNKKRKNIALVKFSKFLWLVSLVFMAILGYFIYDANVLPMKYFGLILCVFVVLITLHGIIVLKKNTKVGVLIAIDLLTFVFMTIETLAIIKINDTISFLRNNLGLKYETNIYNIVVNKNSGYYSISDIENKDVYTFKDLDDFEKVEEILKKKATVNILYDNNMIELLESVKDNNERIIMVNSGNYDAMVETDENYEKSVRIIDTVEIKTEVNTIDNNLNITKEPFVVYLSGIDTRSGTLPSRSLSDVNIVMAINPKTKELLMVHIPRDYYVPIHGIGINDKLTHTGTIGGVNLTMQTIEDLLEIDIPYYVRVNFNSVTNLVDAIGGITVNSDVDYSFTCWTNTSCVIKPGLNELDGKCALAFARERHAYNTGDRHRGENQEQLIEKIIDKVTSSTLIYKYNDILNALDGTFETSLTTDDIMGLVKMQIDDMSSWKVSSYNVTGSGAMLPTYSYPNLNLYVMNPDFNTVNEAVNKLDQVLGTVNEETN